MPKPSYFDYVPLSSSGSNSPSPSSFAIKETPEERDEFIRNVETGALAACHFMLKHDHLTTYPGYGLRYSQRSPSARNLQSLRLGA